MLVVKPARLQKTQCLNKRLLPPHQPGMGAVENEKISHAFELGAFHGHLSIIGPGKHGGQNWIQRAIAGNHPALELCRPQPGRQIIAASSKLESAGAEKVSRERIGSKAVDKLASVVRRRQHYHTSQVV